MKKKHVLIVVLSVLFCLPLVSANAGTISLLPASQDVGIGTGTVIFDVFADFAEDIITPPPTGLGILGGTLNVTYDAAVLGFNSFTYSSAVTNDPANTVSVFSDDGAGTVSQIGFGNFDVFGDGFNVPTFSIGTLILNSLMLENDIGDEVTMATGVSTWRDFNNDVIAVTYENANVNVVPIPGSILLLGSGLVGLIGIARRKRS